MRESFFARRSFVIVMITVFMLPFIWAGTRRAILSNRNDVKEWLPAGFRETGDHRWFQRHFPLEQFVLVSWEGCTLHDHRLELFAQKLVPQVKGEAPGAEAAELDELAVVPLDQKTDEKDEPRFKNVLTGQRLVQELQERYPELSEEEVLERLQGSLIGDDHLKTCLVVFLTEQAKGKELRATLDEIRRIASEECAIRPEDIRLGGPPVDNVAIDVEGERTLMRLAALSAIVGLGVSLICFRSIRLTAIVFWIALLSAGMGLAIVYFSGSSVDAILLTMPSLVYVLAISGAVHIVNYYHDAIEENGLEGATDRAVRSAFYPCMIATLTTALGLGSLVASEIIPISKFGIFSALGVIASLYLLFLYLPALLHYFPSREYAEKHAGKKHVGEDDNVFIRFWRSVGGVVIRHNLVVSAACLMVMVFFAFGVPRMQTSVKLMKLFSPDAEIIAHYGWLEEHLGPLVPMEVVLRFDNEKNHYSFVERMRVAQYIEGELETKLAAVGGALSAATFAPDISRDGRQIGGLNVRDAILNKRLEPYRAEFHEYLNVDTERTETHNPNLPQLRITGPIAELLLDNDVDDLESLESLESIASIEGLTPRQAMEIVGAIEAWKAVRNPTIEQLGLNGELAERLKTRKLVDLKSIERFDDVAYVKGVGPEGAEKVAKAIDKWRQAHGDELWRVSARVEALSDLDYADFLDELEDVVGPVMAYYKDNGVEGIDAVYTGLVPLVYKAQHVLMRGLYESLALAFVLIAFVMMFVLKSPTAGLLAMIPNMFPVVLIFGAMGWIRMLCLQVGWEELLVDVGSMMTASVALGVAVDDTVHYLTWYRRGLDKGLNRKGAVMLAYERCATAMSQTTLIAGLGLAVFAFSTFTPTQRFGVLMLALLGTALIGDLIFLPALLTGPLGRLFGGRRRKQVPVDPPTADEPSESSELDRLNELEGPIDTDDDEIAVPVPSDGPSATMHIRSDAAHTRRSRRPS